MANQPQINKVDEEDDYIHVRFRDPDRFDTIRTPDWAENAASSVREGAEVRTGQEEDSDDWKVEAVLIPDDVDEDQAKDDAKQILDKIENR